MMCPAIGVRSKCLYLARVLLEKYDGNLADETKAARMKAARKYFDLAQTR